MVKIMHFKINVSDLMKINLEQERARVAYYQKKEHGLIRPAKEGRRVQARFTRTRLKRLG
jgi:hypothetical protein